MIPISAILSRLESSGLVAGPGPTPDLVVGGISDDSRTVKSGDLYCAIRGYLHDGHDFLAEAAEVGAAAALVEAPDPALRLPQIRVSDGRRAAAIAAQVVYGEPAAGLQLVGITGTNGKTTTVHVARHILSRRVACGSLGTLGVIGASGAHEATSLTTPGPVQFARYLAQLKEGGAQCVVAEVSSHALAQGRVDGAAFRVGVFTNLSRDHLDYHTDFDDYLAAKSRLAGLVSQDGALVVNANEPAWAGLSSDHRTVRFGIEREADYMASAVKIGARGSLWTLAGPDGAADVRLPLLGAFNVANALAAATAACAMGFALDEVAEALQTTPQVPGRLEALSEKPLVLRDYAHTPDALRAALAALRSLASGRLIVVFGCGGDRDPGKRPLMGRAAAEGADCSIVTSDNPRTEPPEAIIDEILPGVGEASHEVIVDRRAAISRALAMAGDDDVVLLAGKGHETYQVVGNERRPFDEAEIVTELLGT